MAFDRLRVEESTRPLESSGRLIGRGGTGRRATNSSAPCPDRTAARVAPRRFRPRSSRRDPSDCHDSPRIRCVSRRGTRSASYPGVDRRSASSRHRHQDPEPRHLDCPRYRQPRRPIAYRLEQSLNPLVVTNRQAWWVTSDINGKDKVPERCTGQDLRPSPARAQSGHSGFTSSEPTYTPVLSDALDTRRYKKRRPSGRN